MSVWLVIAISVAAAVSHSLSFWVLFLIFSRRKP